MAGTAMMRMTITASCRVSRGPHKTECEDCCLIGTEVVNGASATTELRTPARLYLCDGVGGNAGGRDASLFVCRNVSDDFQTVNEALIEYGRELGKPIMATTLTGLIFREDGVTLVHAGNTRLYALRGGFLNRITTDQTTYEWLKSLGRDEAAELCNKSEIRCAFGGGKREYLNGLIVRDVFTDRIPKTLLFTTDGIHDYLTDDELEQMFRTDGSDVDRMDRMIRAARGNGSQDDCSAILARISENTV